MPHSDRDISFEWRPVSQGVLLAADLMTVNALKQTIALTPAVPDIRGSVPESKSWLPRYPASYPAQDLATPIVRLARKRRSRLERLGIATQEHFKLQGRNVAPSLAGWFRHGREA